MQPQEKTIKERYKHLPKLYKMKIYATLVSFLGYAISYAVTTKLIYSSIEEETLTNRLMIGSLFGLMLSILWLSAQEKLYSLYLWFASIEIFAYLGLTSYVLLTNNFDAYLIVATLIGATITHVVSGGNSKIHENITNDMQARTDYWYFYEVVATIGTILGSCVVFIFKIPIILGFILLFINYTLDNIVSIYIYLKLKKM